MPGVLGLRADTLEPHLDRAGSFLESHGFKLDKSPADRDFFLLSGATGDCQVLVAAVSPQGWHTDIVRKLVPSRSNLLFIYRGQAYSEQPVLITAFNDYIFRFFRMLGAHPRMSPILAVVASPECKVEELPWTEIEASALAE